MYSLMQSNPHQLPGQDTYDRLAELMAEMETILKSAGVWDEEPPPTRALESGQPFCFDTLSFTQWLQWVFIPRVRRLVADREPLPPHSDIVPYAEERLEPEHPVTRRILATVAAFDACINDAARHGATQH